jgi:hypothetical protein
MDEAGAGFPDPDLVEGIREIRFAMIRWRALAAESYADALAAECERPSVRHAASGFQQGSQGAVSTAAVTQVTRRHAQ